MENFYSSVEASPKVALSQSFDSSNNGPLFFRSHTVGNVTNTSPQGEGVSIHRGLKGGQGSTLRTS